MHWEPYLTEPTVWRRNDITDGVRVFPPPPSFRHQRLLGNTGAALRAYEEQTGNGVAVTAPFDVLIRRTPRLQVRQPDALFVTHTTLAQGGGIPASGPLIVAPELIVEIVSDSDRAQVLAGKLADYASIGVAEAWVIRPEPGTVEVLRLAPGAGPVPVAVYGSADTVRSIVLPALTVPVADLLRP